MKHTKICLLFILLFSMGMAGPAFGQTTEWSGTIGGQNISGSYKLTGTVNLNGVLNCNSNATIDLNGQRLIRQNTGHVFTVAAGAKLTLIDSKGGGTVENGHGDRGGCMFLSGTFEFLGGTIKDCKTQQPTVPATPSNANVPTIGGGGAVYINDGGTFIMDGGTIDNCSTYYTSTEHTFVKNNITYRYRGRGGAVFVDADLNTNETTRFIFKSGTIKNCEAGMGGGVYVHAPVVNKGTTIFEMYKDANIINCKSSLSAAENTLLGGGGVMVSSTANGVGQFHMKGGTISGCQSASKGCGVLLLGTMTMEEGSLITKCYPVGWDSKHRYPSTAAGSVYGGGVFTNTNRAHFTMYGGKIEDNIAASGGGVMVWGNTEEGSSKFTMNGDSAIIRGNHALGRGGLGNGGAVYVQTATFEFKKGTLQNNRAVRYGGAVNINSSANLLLQGECKVIGNKAQHGGGLSQESGQCVMELTHSGIHISDNWAEGLVPTDYDNSAADKTTPGIGNGGGLFIEKGKLAITAGNIYDNHASGDGAGVSFRISRITGDAEVEITGGNIVGNIAGKSGGGIDIYANPGAAGDEDANGKNDVLINLKDGTLSNNTAQNGGGVHIAINTANSTAKINLGTTTTVPLVENNIASQNGGAFAMNYGTIDIINGQVSNNNAGETSGLGGAVYLGAGTFNVTGHADIKGNKAYNGGAICVQNGTVSIADGIIEQNEAYNSGGGLYVDNTESAPKNITFSGGTFRKNRAKNGGGVYTKGNLIFSIAATIEENVAHNGGGIYLDNGVTMNFGTGLIRSNQAIADSLGAELTTAFGVSGLHGVGGGIFLNSGTNISFTNVQQFGLYNNRAANAADDLFAAGNETTSVKLPAVNSMSLKGFDVPTDRLYWVEDYVTGDTQYDTYGTKKKNAAESVWRYQYALRNMKKVAHIEDSELAEIEKKYLCLSLGYELVFLHLIKKNLDPGDIVTFSISYKDKSTGNMTDYLDVYMVGQDGKDSESFVVLPSGLWHLQESHWGWKYSDKPEYTPAPDEEGMYDIAADKVKEITIKNNKLPEYENKDIRDSEFIKVNRIKP